jgi:DNA-binding GntR family transcriptional regulator
MADAMDKLEKYLREKGEIEGVDSRLLREVAYERLQEGIRQADLQPGEPLSETRISRALGISRTPVREALQRLAKDGLVQVIPGRAVTVAAPSIQEVLDALHVRELLEPEMVRLAAEALSDAERETLQRLTQEMEQTARSGNRAGWSKADIQWHQELAETCPNRLLGQMVLQARNRMYSVGADNHVTDQYLIDGTLEHKEIIAAIAARDGEKACRLMLEHIRNVRENMFKRLVRY